MEVDHNAKSGTTPIMRPLRLAALVVSDLLISMAAWGLYLILFWKILEISMLASAIMAMFAWKPMLSMRPTIDDITESQKSKDAGRFLSVILPGILLSVIVWGVCYSYEWWCHKVDWLAAVISLPVMGGTHLLSELYFAPALTRGLRRVFGR